MKNLLQVCGVAVWCLCGAQAVAKIPRSHQAIAQFKHEQPCPATGRAAGACPGWVIDHRIALACGGADSPANMQWQTVADAKEKDRWELLGCTTKKSHHYKGE